MRQETVEDPMIGCDRCKKVVNMYSLSYLPDSPDHMCKDCVKVATDKFIQKELQQAAKSIIKQIERDIRP